MRRNNINGLPLHLLLSKMQEQLKLAGSAQSYKMYGWHMHEAARFLKEINKKFKNL